MRKFICIHAHFYQPPRENPWLEEIELQDSAYPYHDWNKRITAECYGPNASARILGQHYKIIDIVNNYSKISFNFGPTLLSGLQKNNPDVYGRIIEADRESMEVFSGHGSAIAQVHNHMIMPLATGRDKKTQALWGIRDFQKRFGRDPEGMWLPETAVDTETLEVLAGLGIKFTVLSPRQARRTRRMKDGGPWQEANPVDATRSYLCRLPSGGSIGLFFYDGAISHELGFGGLLNSGEEFARRLVSALPPSPERPVLVSIATDGESYGHHHKHGDMALSYCLHLLRSKEDVRLTNYPEFLATNPPEYLAEVHENSSWSCVHGIERWRSDCGCNSGRGDWHQRWRAPLRAAMDWLNENTAVIFEEEGSKYLIDPWEARDSYIDVILDRSQANVSRFFRARQKRRLGREEEARVLGLLEMERNSMLGFTSCGWFFDEISGIETVQVMSYAARAMQLAAGMTGRALEPVFLELLEKAPSNYFENGRKAYEALVKPAELDLLRVGAHYAISSLFQEYNRHARVYCYGAENIVYDRLEAGKLKLGIGVARIRSNITWEETTLSFAVLHMGEQNINGGIKYYGTGEEYGDMKAELEGAFARGDAPEVIRLMDKRFGANSYSLWHIFKDEQRRIIDNILAPTYRGIEGSYGHIFEDNFNLMEFLRMLNIPLPKPLLVTAEYTVNMRIKEILEDPDFKVEQLKNIIRVARELSLQLDSSTLGFVATSWLNRAITAIRDDTDGAARIESVKDVLGILKGLPIAMNLWNAQNIYFSLAKNPPEAVLKTAAGDPARWTRALRELGDLLDMKVP